MELLKDYLLGKTGYNAYAFSRRGHAETTCDNNYAHYLIERLMCVSEANKGNESLMLLLSEVAKALADLEARKCLAETRLAEALSLVDFFCTELNHLASLAARKGEKHDR